jgi:hypothetical protein
MALIFLLIARYSYGHCSESLLVDENRELYEFYEEFGDSHNT